MANEVLPRCRVVPMPGAKAAFFIDGKECLCWHYGGEYPRPFFYPLIGPAGESLTRMGHPGAPNHDHHRSVWFAHASINGIDFWSDQGKGRVVQNSWQAYEDGTDEAIMAAELGWHDHSGKPIMNQNLIAAIRPLEEGEWTLELQSTFGINQDRVVLDQSNFGFLAVRMAKSIAAFFGAGRITSSEGDEGESQIFGKYARWMDYSGPVLRGVQGDPTKMRWNGITYFDHAANPRYPAHWHVREDGWMGASFCRLDDFEITPDRSLELRYLLHVHDGPLSPDRANTLAESFNRRPRFKLRHRPTKHREYGLEREPIE